MKVIDGCVFSARNVVTNVYHTLWIKIELDWVSSVDRATTYPNLWRPGIVVFVSITIVHMMFTNIWWRYGLKIVFCLRHASPSHAELLTGVEYVRLKI